MGFSETYASESLWSCLRVGLNFVCAAIGSFIHGRKNSERSFKRENGVKRMDATGGVEWWCVVPKNLFP